MLSIVKLVFKHLLFHTSMCRWGSVLRGVVEEVCCVVSLVKCVAQDVAAIVASTAANNAALRNNLAIRNNLDVSNAVLPNWTILIIQSANWKLKFKLTKFNQPIENWNWIEENSISQLNIEIESKKVQSANWTLKLNPRKLNQRLQSIVIWLQSVHVKHIHILI